MSCVNFMVWGRIIKIYWGIVSFVAVWVWVKIVWQGLQWKLRVSGYKLKCFFCVCKRISFFIPSDSRREAYDLQHKEERRWHVHLCGYQHGWREGQRDSASHSVWWASFPQFSWNINIPDKRALSIKWWREKKRLWFEGIVLKEEATVDVQCIFPHWQRPTVWHYEVIYFYPLCPFHRATNLPPEAH